MEIYSIPYEVRWTDIDANRHVRYSAYIDAAAEMRYRFLAQNNFPPTKLASLDLGLVYTSLVVNFYREVLLGETLTITLKLAGLSPKGIRWKVHHHFQKANGKKAVTLLLEGAFINMKSRQPMLPPPELLELFQSVPRDSDFMVMSDTRWFGR